MERSWRVSLDDPRPTPPFTSSQLRPLSLIPHGPLFPPLHPYLSPPTKFSLHSPTPTFLPYFLLLGPSPDLSSLPLHQSQPSYVPNSSPILSSAPHPLSVRNYLSLTTPQSSISPPQLFLSPLSPLPSLTSIPHPCHNPHNSVLHPLLCLPPPSPLHLTSTLSCFLIPLALLPSPFSLPLAFVLLFTPFPSSLAFKVSVPVLLIITIKCFS